MKLFGEDLLVLKGVSYGHGPQHDEEKCCIVLQHRGGTIDFGKSEDCS